MANLALCARMAHQGGLVGNAGEFRNPQGKRCGRPFSGYSFVAVDKRVTRPRCEYRKAKLKGSRKCYKKEIKRKNIPTRSVET